MNKFWGERCFETYTKIYITLEQTRAIDEDLVKDIENDCIKKFSSTATECWFINKLKAL
jgi:hypothetical protein